MPLALDATAWAQARYRVFPVRPLEKKAAVGGYQHRATTDTSVIERWWQGDYIGYNVGVIADQRVIVDLDIHKNANVLALAQALGCDIHTTLSQRTPRGGYHLFYSHDCVVASSVGLLPGIDIRSGNAYVVGAHSATIDGTYELLMPLDTPLSPVPLALAQCLRPLGSRE